MKDMNWFKAVIAPQLNNYEMEYKHFEKEGDFGILTQVVFESERLGGNIDFWGLNWLGIFIWDYPNEIELMNVLLEPNEEEKKDIAFEQFKKYLQ